MVRQRRPIKRPRHTVQFTPEVLAAFKHLRQVYEEGDCTCPPELDRLSDLRCKSCQAYDKAETEVVGLLNLQLWQLLVNPYQASLYPAGSPAEQIERNHPVNRQGRALWRRLEAACGLSRLKEEECEQ